MLFKFYKIMHIYDIWLMKTTRKDVKNNTCCIWNYYYDYNIKLKYWYSQSSMFKILVLNFNTCIEQQPLLDELWP